MSQDIPLRISSTRGIITAQNHRGHPLPLVALKQWIRYTRQVLNAEKIDIYVNGNTYPVVLDLLDCAKEIGCRLGLYIDEAVPTDQLARWKEKGLLAVTLIDGCKESSKTDWYTACHEHAIPIDLHLSHYGNHSSLVELAQRYPIRTVTFTTDLPFSRKRVDSFDSEYFQKIIPVLEEQGVSVRIESLPFCAVPESLWPYISNSAQRALDHNAYIHTSLTLAQTIYSHRVYIGTKIIRMILARHTLHKTSVDEILLPFILKRSYRYVITRFIRRVTEHLNIAKSLPREEQESHYDTVLRESLHIPNSTIYAACDNCSFNRICDHAALAPTTFVPCALEGEASVNPMHYRSFQKIYYDEIDAERVSQQRPSNELLEIATTIIRQQPTTILKSEDYCLEDSFSKAMEGGVRWWSVSRSEKLSMPLGTFNLPLTISVDIGGGIADYIGFSFGRHIKIMYPMEAYRHTLAIHINAKGQYILLRDGFPVIPTEFKGLHYLPLHLGDRLHPQLSIWNVDESVVIQGLRIWHGEAPEPIRSDDIKYSIIIVSTQFSRRLQAVLANLAHQQDFDLSTLEVIVAYVPGLDATDDLIDSLNLAHPNFRIIRSAFPENKCNAKGFMINESAKLAHGEWIMLLDSDIILPPDYFARIESVSDTETFIAPDGRRMLTPETTASILLGDVTPSKDWEALVSDSGDFRHRETSGVPVGFCQCFKAHYLSDHPYLEMDHFEFSDMDFGMKLLKEVGREHRLSGAPVLHLDHSGSQWYGTRKQL